MKVLKLGLPNPHNTIAQTNRQRPQKAAVFCFAVYESIPNQTTGNQQKESQTAKQMESDKRKPNNTRQDKQQEPAKIKKYGKIKRLFTLLALYKKQTQPATNGKPDNPLVFDIPNGIVSI